MPEILGIVAAVAAVVLAIGRTLRGVARDGYGRRTPVPPGRADPTRDWSADLPSRPYREM